MTLLQVIDKTINITIVEVFISFLAVAASWVLLGFTWSRVMANRTKQIADSKLDKEVFRKHEENNDIQFHNIQNNHEEYRATLDNISKRVDDIYKLLTK